MQCKFNQRLYYVCGCRGLGGSVDGFTLEGPRPIGHRDGRSDHQSRSENRRGRGRSVHLTGKEYQMLELLNAPSLQGIGHAQAWREVVAAA
jgi:hypothetical protein